MGLGKSTFLRNLNSSMNFYPKWQQLSDVSASKSWQDKLGSFIISPHLMLFVISRIIWWILVLLIVKQVPSCVKMLATVMTWCILKEMLNQEKERYVSCFVTWWWSEIQCAKLYVVVSSTCGTVFPTTLGKKVTLKGLFIRIYKFSLLLILVIGYWQFRCPWNCQYDFKEASRSC